MFKFLAILLMSISIVSCLVQIIILPIRIFKKKKIKSILINFILYTLLIFIVVLQNNFWGIFMGIIILLLSFYLLQTDLILIDLKKNYIKWEIYRAKFLRKNIDLELAEIDNMGGIQFENYVANLLKKNGFYNVQVTQASNDYGIDILAKKRGIKYAIQCKNYSNRVGNSAIQEAYTGKNYYNADKAAVFTNNYFTQNASNLAQINNVELWDRDVLTKMIKMSNAVSDNFIYKDELIKQPIIDEDDYDENFFCDCIFLSDDELVNNVVSYTVHRGSISSSKIQMKFKIGFNRALRLIDDMEKMGIIKSIKNNSIEKKVIMSEKK